MSPNQTGKAFTRRRFLAWTTGAAATLGIGQLVVSCGGQAPQPTAQAVQPTTQVVQPTTQVVQSTPQIVEKIVTQVVEKQVVITPTPAPTPAAAAATSVDWKKVPIMHWTMFALAEGKLIQDQIDRFNKEKGANAIVMSVGWANVIEKAQIAIEGGNPPDLVTLWSEPYTWGPRGLLRPLEDYAKRDNYTSEGWVPQAWDLMWSEGHFWGPGNLLNVNALHINKDLFASAGLGEKWPTTVPELDAAADKLTTWDSGKTNLTRIGFLPWQGCCYIPFENAYAFGGRFYDEAKDKVICNTDPGVLKSMQWAVDYAKRYDIDKIDRFRSGFGKGGTPDEPWYVGKTAIEPSGSWKRMWINRNAPKLNYVVVKTPPAPGLPWFSYTETVPYSIPKGAKNPDGAWELAKEFSSPRCSLEYCILVGDVPPRLEVLRDPKWLNALPYQEVFVELTEKYLIPWPKMPVLATYKSEMDRLLDQAIHGKVEVQAGLNAVAQKVQKELDDFRAQTKK